MESGPVLGMFFDRGVMGLRPGLRPTEGDEKRLESSHYCPWHHNPPLVIPSEAEGSAVPRTLPGNVFRQSVA
jgi:hypothetical protein